MAKGNNNVRNKKPHTSKPYDVSNSFVKKVTLGVSSLLPQASWLSRWFASTSTAASETVVSSNDEVADREEDHINQPPPAKRARIPLNRPFSPNSFRVSSPLDRGETHPWPCESIASPIPNVFSDSTPGPSGLNRTPVAPSPFQQSATTAEGLDGKLNGDGGSESSESTSGCSSLPPQRGANTDQTTVHGSSENKISNHMSPHSLFPSATHKLSTSNNQSLSRRRPSFSISSFTSPNLESSKFSRESSLNSPFYIGRTIYGGASAYRRPRDVSNSERMLSSIRRGGVSVRPSNEKSQPCASAEVSMSQTARRILEALEQFSSPVSEARRMPLPPQPPLSAKRKRPLELSITPPGKGPLPPAATNPLSIPVLPERLRLHRLQDASAAARRIASTVTYTTSQYTLRNNEDRDESRTGKVTKSKPLDADEQPLPVNLPHVSLPITNLPSFDMFNLPLKTSCVNSRTETSKIASVVENFDQRENKVPAMSASRSSEVESTGTSANAEIVTPHVNPTKESAKGAEVNQKTWPFDLPKASAVSSLTAKGAPFSPVRTGSDTSLMTNDFVFSTPTVVSTSISKEITESKVKNFEFCKPEILDNSKHTKLNQNEPNGFHKLQSNVKFNCVQESVLNESSKEECNKLNVMLGSECNSKSSSMVKSGSSDGSQNNGWGTRFKAADTWECSSCLVRNKNSEKVCVCCGVQNHHSSSPSSSKKSDVQDNAQSSKKTFGSAKLVSQQGTSECSACLVHGKDKDVSCVACTAIKATQGMSLKTDWGSQFKLGAGKWECSSCLVRNEENSTKCVACSTSQNELAKEKSGKSESSDKSKLNDFGDKFKKPSSNWECPVCMIQNKNADMKCAACQEPKPGMDMNRSSTGGRIKFNFEMPAGISDFKFGIDKASVKHSGVNSAAFTFGGSHKGESDGTLQKGFTFGIPPANGSIPAVVKFGTSTTNVQTVEKSSSDSTASSGEKLSSCSNSPLSQKLVQEKSNPKITGFSFGISNNKSIPTCENTQESKNAVQTSDIESANKVSSFTSCQGGRVTGQRENLQEKENVFGSAAQKEKSGSDKTSADDTKGFAFKTPATTTATPTSVSTTAQDATTKTQGFNFSLGAPTTTKSSTTPTSVVTSTTAASPLASSPALFSLGGAKTSASSVPTFSFAASGAQTSSSGIFGASPPGQFKSSGEGLFAKPAASVFGNNSASSVQQSFGSSVSSSLSTSTAATTASKLPETTASSAFVSQSATFVAPATTATPTFGSGITSPSFGGGFGGVTTSTAASSVTPVSSSVLTSSGGATPVPGFTLSAKSVSFGTAGTSTFNSTNASTFGTSVPTFGASTTTASNTVNSPATGFATSAPTPFGSSAGAGNTFGASGVNQSFNTTTPSVFGSTSTPAFGSTSATSAFGTSTTGGFGNSFGSVTTTTPTFGSSAAAVTTTSTTNAPTQPSFGALSNAQKPAHALFLFGSNSTIATTQSSGFSFNSASRANGGQAAPSGSAVFSFGSAAASVATNVITSTSTTPTASAAAAPSAAAPAFVGGFSFCGAASPALAAPSVFGNAAAAAAAPATATVFGSPALPTSAPATPAFGAGNVMNNVFRQPAFASGSPQPFTFGSAASPSAPQAPSTSGFTFGQGGQGQTPSQSQTQPQPLQFNPNVRPSFNFTGGETPQFTASQAIPARKVKKAVRRVVRN